MNELMLEIYRFFGKCWHEWQPWEDHKDGNLTRGSGITGYYMEQKRSCKHCKMTQTRIEKTEII